MPSHRRELREAHDAIERARPLLRGLAGDEDARRRIARRIADRLRTASQWSDGTLGYSVGEVYSAVRVVLPELDKLEHGLDAHDRERLAELVSELHRVEDLLETAFWRDV